MPFCSNACRACGENVWLQSSLPGKVRGWGCKCTVNLTAQLLVYKVSLKYPLHRGTHSAGSLVLFKENNIFSVCFGQILPFLYCYQSKEQQMDLSLLPGLSSFGRSSSNWCSEKNEIRVPEVHWVWYPGTWPSFCLCPRLLDRWEDCHRQIISPVPLALSYPIFLRFMVSASPLPSLQVCMGRLLWTWHPTPNISSFFRQMLSPATNICSLPITPVTNPPPPSCGLLSCYPFADYPWIALLLSLAA